MSIRYRSGKPFHKHEFSSDDNRERKIMIKFLHDKVGFSRKVFKEALGDNFDKEEFKNVKDLFAKQIKDGREKTRKAMKGSFEKSKNLAKLREFEQG